MSGKAHAEALARMGVPAPLLEILRSWVEVTVEARLMQRQQEQDRITRELIAIRHVAPQSTEDPSLPLSAGELGKALGNLSDETVRLRERSGELFSVLRPGRKRGREYPSFQSWAGIAGKPLTEVLKALGVPSAGSAATAAYGFFTSPNDLLGGLTPVEALHGRQTSPRDLSADAKELLAAPEEVRRRAAVAAACAAAADRTA